MDTDKKLREILITLRDAEAKSPQHQYAQNQLIKFLTQFPDVKKCRDARIDCEAVMQEAYLGLLKTIKGFFLTIDLDNTPAPEVRVRLIKRFNRIVKNKEFDEYRKQGKQPFSLDNPLSEDEGNDTYLDFVTYEGFIDENYQPSNLPPDDFVQSIGSKLWQYINADPEEKLRGCHPKHRSDANCQVIAQRLQLKDPPDNLADIAKELDINYQTVNSHWKRSCLPLLRQIARKFGYTTEA